MTDTKPCEESEAAVRGMQIRREVLGDAHVDRTLTSVNDFSRPMHEFVTEFCWGEVWSRPGLTRQTRSLLNIAILTALSHHGELRAHTRGALRNGCSIDEIQEVIIQTAVYCGFPAALSATRSIQAELKELAKEAAEEQGGS